MPDGAWGAEGHVIVCGLHGVGLRTVEQLHQSRVPVVVVDDDPDPRLAQVVEGWGLTLIRRSARIGDGLAGRRPRAGPGRDLRRVRRVGHPRDRHAGARGPAGRPAGRADGQSVGGPGPGAGPRFRGHPGPGRPGRPLVRRGVPAAGGRTSWNWGASGSRWPRWRWLRTRPPGRTFRSRFGHLAPVAVVPEDGSGHRLLPGPRPSGGGGGPGGGAGHAGRARPGRSRPA